MSRRPSRRAVLAVRAVKVAATSALAGTAIVLTLSGAFATSGEPVGRLEPDARCAGTPGKAIVRTQSGATRAVAFEHGWKIYRGERPGTLVVVCPD